MTGEPTVIVEDLEGVRRVTLCRPPVNALTLVEYDALAAAFTLPSTRIGSPRAVLLRATGATWCAGQDLGEFSAQAGPGERAAYLLQATQGVAAAARCPVPIVTVLDGPAIGAGALLVACSDVVLSTERGSLAFPELRLGLRLGRSLLSGLLPEPVITHAFVTGLAVGAERLHQMGAVAEIVPIADLDARAEEVVADLLSLSDGSLRWLCRRDGTRAEAYLDEVALVAEYLG